MYIIVRELCGHRRLLREWTVRGLSYLKRSQSCYSQMGKGGSAHAAILILRRENINKR